MPTQEIDFSPPTAEAAPYLRPVTASLFAERAERFAHLAIGHSLGDWLNFLGQLTRAQHVVLQTLPELPLPDSATLEQARRHGMPPLDPGARPAVWREVLRQLVRSLEAPGAAGVGEALLSLREATDSELEKLADTLLDGVPEADQAARLVFVGAALQVVYTALASQLAAGRWPALEVHGVCPCCGSLPVASVVRLGAAINNLRYLHCSLCNSEWNVPRATCSACSTDQSVALHEIEGANSPVRAETCDACNSYLKIVYQEKDPHVDPVADDLATLALDMLVDEAGYQRAGPNLLLISTAA
ncbi:MAG: Formate dehydrogenase accessory protein [Proteobacteria bacterium]|nr:Formate dehydrogenase accessory protein [Pseudomonadota bacterium]